MRPRRWAVGLFLTLTGLWSRRQESCPLTYASPNAPSEADVLGTWMLWVLCGRRRHSHVTAIRCGGVNPGLLPRAGDPASRRDQVA